MSAQIDCPICMDCIESTTKNCVTTDCGHCFHTNCLMQSVAHNGFGCPYCRTAMAEEPEEEEESVWSDIEEEDEEMFDDNALRGFRFFFNNLFGEEHDEADETDEQEVEEGTTSDEVEDTNVPTTDFVAQKLKDQGVTFEQLVKIICEYDHVEYENDEAAERLGSELFGKIRIIVSNYTPEQAAVQHQTQVPTEPLQQSAVDFTAQPKTTHVRSFHRINIHV